MSGNEPDGLPANDSDSESTSVNAVGGPSVDLSISIADAPDPASVGQDVTYTATVANAGPAGATSVTLTDTLPAGVTFVSATSSQGACSQLAGTVTCALGSMVLSGSATVAIVVRPTVPGTIIDAATVQAAEVEPTPADASDSESTQVDASADLSITKVATPNPVALGQNLTYTMVVANAGPSDATGVTLTDPLPPGVTFVSANSLVGPCAFATGTLTCAIGDLAANASAAVTVVVTPTVAGAISNTATVDANQPDPAAANDAAMADTVAPSADLSLTKTASPDPVIAGEDLTYTLVVTNAGPSDAAGVTVTDTLPAGIAFVSADVGGSETNGTVTGPRRPALEQIGDSHARRAVGRLDDRTRHEHGLRGGDHRRPGLRGQRCRRHCDRRSARSTGYREPLRDEDRERSRPDDGRPRHLHDHHHRRRPR